MNKGELLKITGLSQQKGAGEQNFRIIAEALERIKKENFSGISLPEGNYEVYNRKALELFGFLLDGTIASLDNNRWKKEKNVLFSVSQTENFTIKGNNTSLMFKGLMQPFDFKDVSGLTVRDLSVNFEDCFYTCAKVTGKIGDTVYITPECGYEISGGEPIVSLQNYDVKTSKPLGMALFEGISNIMKTKTGEFCFNCTEHNMITVGESLILRYLYSYSSTFMMYRCSDVKIQNVKVFAAPGLAVVAQKCRNMLFDRLRVMPFEKRPMSANCDATHLINCIGDVVYDNCYFEGMGDDASNVHGFYLTVYGINDDKVYVKHRSSSQNTYPYVPVKGDSVEFINEKNLLCFANGKISDVSYDEKRELYVLKFEEGVPSGLKEESLIASVTEMPRLTFKNCTVKNIRGRGVLIQTRNVLVENCLFENCTGQGIHIDTAYGWGESIGTRNVQIRNNKFIDCGFGSTKYCDAVGVVIETEAEEPAVGVHKDICIEKNLVKGSGAAFNIRCAENVTVRENLIIGCNEEIPVSNSVNVEITDNIFD